MLSIFPVSNSTISYLFSISIATTHSPDPESMRICLVLESRGHLLIFISEYSAAFDAIILSFWKQLSWSIVPYNSFSFKIVK